MNRIRTIWNLAAAVAALAACSPALAQKRVVSPWDIEAREYLGTPGSEAAVSRGLAYLASHQRADGHWRSGPFESEVGITGLAVMAFLASGSQPGRGRYGAALSQAIDYLASSVQMSGSMVPAGMIRAGAEEHPMYGHGFATLALCESYGMAGRSDLKPKIEAAIRLIEDTQTQNGDANVDGGWRYQPQQGDADISVTVVQVLALRAARNAGFRVAQSTLDRAMSYIKRCANNANGGFSYQVQQHAAAYPRTAAGALMLLMANQRQTPECRNALAFMLARSMDRRGIWPPIQHFYYGLYYTTQAMYQAGGKFWQNWFPLVRERLVHMQYPDGGWSENDPYSEAGVEYATAMSVLVLQVPAGLLPIYQK